MRSLYELFSKKGTPLAEVTSTILEVLGRAQARTYWPQCGWVSRDRIRVMRMR